jgi:hypothetical protein
MVPLLAGSALDLKPLAGGAEVVSLARCHVPGCRKGARVRSFSNQKKLSPKALNRLARWHHQGLEEFGESVNHLMHSAL